MSESITKTVQVIDSSTWSLVGRIFRAYLKPYLKRIAVALAFMVISAAMTVAFAKLIEPVMDLVLIGKRESLIFPMSFLVFAVFVINGVSSYIYTVIMNMTGQGIVADIQRDVFSRFMKLDLQFFHDNPSGQLVSRIVSDVNAMRAAVSDTITGIGKNFLTLIFLVTLMFFQDAHLAFIAFCVFPVAGLFVTYLGKRLRKVSKSIQLEIAGFSDILIQIFQGMRQVKAYGMETYEINRADKAIEKVKKLQFKGIRIGNLSTPVNETLLGLSLMGVIMYGGHQVVNGTLTVGELMSFITAFSLSYEPLKRLAKLNNNLQMGLGAAERVFEMMDKQPAIIDRPDAKTLAVSSPAIEYDNVSFAYGRDDGYALKAFSLRVPAGKVTALVGSSGSGKTTALNLVPRFYDVREGRVLIDGEDVRDVTLESLRRHISLVSQDITIFDDTVANNIAYGRIDATREEIEEAARSAAAEDFILSLPGGYETRLGEHGVKLSGGQRQRIAIARAMLRDAPILLLDEATSALDNESERAIQESLERLQKGRTTIVIAHRLSTIQKADQIVVLHQGHIAEIGTHKALLDKKGMYARMHSFGVNLESAA